MSRQCKGRQRSKHFMKALLYEAKSTVDRGLELLDAVFEG
mgnify:CR=1 FL=1|jgi:hypothetical protein